MPFEGFGKTYPTCVIENGSDDGAIPVGSTGASEGSASVDGFKELAHSKGGNDVIDPPTTDENASPKVDCLFRMLT
jgi:hypothetical protein